jgi:uncharacterized coiled-coil protein SlyX
MPTPLDLAHEALRMAELATPGPWSIDESTDAEYRVVSDGYEDETPGVCGKFSRQWCLESDDAEFIAFSRSTLPALAAALIAQAEEMERLRARMDGLKNSLRDAIKSIDSACMTGEDLEETARVIARTLTWIEEQAELKASRP